MRRRELLTAGVALGGSLVAGCQDSEPQTETASPPKTDVTDSATPPTTSTATETRKRTGTVADEPVIKVADEMFAPRRLRVEPGTRVTWHNVGGGTHSVESELFNPGVATEWSYYSMDLLRDVRASHTFEEPGAYEYDCGVHRAENMCGVVLVGDVRYGKTLPCEKS